METQNSDSATSVVNPDVDGLTLPCAVCGLDPVKLDYAVTDEAWRRVVTRKEEALSVVCWDCFDWMSPESHLADVQVIYLTSRHGGTRAFVPARAEA